MMQTNMEHGKRALWNLRTVKLSTCSRNKSIWISIYLNTALVFIFQSYESSFVEEGYMINDQPALLLFSLPRAHDSPSVIHAITMGSLPDNSQVLPPSHPGLSSQQPYLSLTYHLLLHQFLAPSFMPKPTLPWSVTLPPAFFQWGFSLSCLAGQGQSLLQTLGTFSRRPMPKRGHLLLPCRPGTRVPCPDLLGRCPCPLGLPFWGPTGVSPRSATSTGLLSPCRAGQGRSTHL